MTEIEKDVIDYIREDLEDDNPQFIWIDKNTLGYTDEILKRILIEDYELEENTAEYEEYKKAFENAEFTYTEVETVYGDFSETHKVYDEFWEEFEEWEEEVEYEITMKKI